ncbi:hypothetical protein BASA81_009276 [Batrachochytrium salamandrivorans]|nr:hypothetical protein BASA81_009276 [Batrachochytrium salamandrivorans]
MSDKTRDPVQAGSQPDHPDPANEHMVQSIPKQSLVPSLQSPSIQVTVNNPTTVSTNQMHTLTTTPSSIKRFIMPSSNSPISQYAKKLRMPPTQERPMADEGSWSLSTQGRYRIVDRNGESISERLQRIVSLTANRGLPYHHHRWQISDIELVYRAGSETVVIAQCTADDATANIYGHRIIAFRTTMPETLHQNTCVCIFEPVVEPMVPLISPSKWACSIGDVESGNTSILSNLPALLCRHFDII